MFQSATVCFREKRSTEFWTYCILILLELALEPHELEMPRQTLLALWGWQYGKRDKLRGKEGVTLSLC